MTTSARPSRIFTTARDGTRAVVHDPLTGLTHLADRDVPTGRVRLEDAEVAAWPIVHPGEIDSDMPASVCWSPIVRCNLPCAHCLDDKTVSELGRAGRLRVAQILAASSILGIDISGGEPLLLRDLADLADVLTAAGRAVSVTTNGTHLARRAEALAGHVDAVRVSLDGADAVQHDRLRSEGSFAKATAGIRAAVAHGIPTQIQMVLMRSSTRSGLQPMIDLALSLGVRGVTFLQMLPFGEGAALARAEQLSDAEARELVDDSHGGGGVAVRLRTRDAAGGFTVIRADGQVWRNHPGATAIATLRPLDDVSALALSGRDGSA